jgi:ELWxxDGT repeat protein
VATPRLVKVINPGILASKNDGGWSQGQFSAVGDLLAFLVADSLDSPREVWRSDGSPEGTFKLGSDITSGLNVHEGSLFFNTTQGLWISDASASRTRQLNVFPEDANVYIDSIFRIGDDTIASGGGWPYYGFWSIDKDNSYINQIISTRSAEGGAVRTIGNSFYFAARDNQFGNYVNIELWKSDGTEDGTSRVSDIRPGNRTDESSNPRRLTVLGKSLLFTATNGKDGYELWKSDGTELGTTQVADINLGANSSVNGLESGSYQFTVSNNNIYFSATDGNSGYELWKSDGTLNGTKIVLDLLKGPQSSSPREITAVGNDVFFTAFSSDGLSLWRTNGTESGTEQIFGTNSGAQNFYRGEPRYLTQVGNSIFFSANGDPNTGRELWKSDGSPQGTRLLADLFPGSKSSDPRDLKLVGNTLYFSAKRNEEEGRQLWALDVSELIDNPPPPSDPSLPDYGDRNITINGNAIKIWSADGTFRNLKDTYVLFHGWRGLFNFNGFKNPPSALLPPVAGESREPQIADALIQIENSLFPGDSQVLLVDWGESAVDTFLDFLDHDNLFPYKAGGQIDPIARWVADQLRVIEGEITLIGHSLGGIMAAEVSKNLGSRPNLVTLDIALPARLYDLDAPFENGEEIDNGPPKRVSPLASVSSTSLGLVAADGSIGIDPDLIAGDNDFTGTASTSLVIVFDSEQDFNPHSEVQYIYKAILERIPITSPLYSSIFKNSLDSLELSFPVDVFNNKGEIDFLGFHEGVIYAKKVNDASGWVLTAICGIDKKITFPTRNRILVEDLHLQRSIYVNEKDKRIDFSSGHFSIIPDIEEEFIDYEFSLSGATATGYLSKTLTWYSGVLHDIVVNSSGQVISADELVAAVSWTGKVINNGIIKHTSSNNDYGLYFGNGASENVLFRNNGIYELYGPKASLDSLDPSDPNRFINNGLLKRQGEGESIISIHFENNGNVEVLDGLLRISGQDYIQNNGLTYLRGSVLSLDNPFEYKLIGGELKGSGSINGNLFNGGHIRPGNSIGSLYINGDLRQSNTGILEIDIAGNQVGFYDQLSINGHASFDGHIRLEFIDGFRPSVGDQFELIRFGSYDGLYDSLDITLDDSLSGQLIYLKNSLLLSIAVPTPINDGAAIFSIAGTPAVGNTLSANTSSADPDGNGVFTYSWQTSTDGSSWNPVGTNSSSYLVASADQGKQLRLVVSYSDGEGFPESVTTSAGTVPLLPPPPPDPDPPSIGFSASPPNHAEGNIGSTPFTYSITRSGDLSQVSTVSWQVVGSGLNPATAMDFAGGSLPSSLLTFQPGQDTLPVVVNVVGDMTLEANEGFEIVLSAPTNAVFASARSTVSSEITNDDQPGATYSFTAIPDPVYEGSLLAIGVSTTNVAPGTPVFWQFSGTGISGADFSDGQLTGNTVIGMDGRAAFTKRLAADGDVDPDETLELRFFTDSSYTQQVGSTTTITLKEPNVGVATDDNDIVIGTAAAESISGVPVGSALRGRGSLDHLTGNGSADTFALGDAFGLYYDDGTPGLGTTDLAVVTDFTPSDRIQLFGANSDYRLVSGRYSRVPGVRIDALNGSAGGPEAIGFVQGATLATLNLSDPTQFLFV